MIDLDQTRIGGCSLGSLQRGGRTIFQKKKKKKKKKNQKDTRRVQIGCEKTSTFIVHVIPQHFFVDLTWCRTKDVVIIKLYHHGTPWHGVKM